MYSATINKIINNYIIFTTFTQIFHGQHKQFRKCVVLKQTKNLTCSYVCIIKKYMDIRYSQTIKGVLGCETNLVTIFFSLGVFSRRYNQPHFSSYILLFEDIPIFNTL